MTITPTIEEITASKGLKPRRCRASIAKAPTAVIRPAGKSGTPKSRFRASAAPMNSAAEFIGAALALNLLFGVPLFPAGLITAVGAFAILALQRRGFRPLEAVISSMVGVIVIAFALQMFYAQPEGDRILAGLFTPQFA